MKVGILRVSLFIPYSHSLKDKRSTVNSLKEKLKNRFNVSVAEVGDNDKWQKAELGISMVSNDGKHINKELDKVLSFMRNHPTAFLSDEEREIL